MKQSKLSTSLFSGVFAVLVGVSGSALAQSGEHAQHGTTTPAASAGAQQHEMAGHEMMQTMQDMHQKMSAMQMTGDPDHNFAMMMRAHHQAGVDMANAEIKNGKDKQMLQAAKKIVADQTKEIKKLDQWMEKHKASGK
jgi:uncharacterized protein (DUF305 family)